MSLDGENQPVVGISWQQAALYCNWLSEQEGRAPFYQIQAGFVSGVNPESTGYRLLTEAEWTWLAKVASSQLVRVFPWGNEPEPRPVDNFAGAEIAGNLNFTLAIRDAYPVSAPVGSFPPNDKGIYDLGGNVAEYLHDWYAVEAPSSETLVDPLGPDQGEYRVIRGASWSRGYLPQLRLAYRDYDAVGRNDVGFRIGRYAR
jgi:formylglycine-generating enzyme required for sulfatase activity